MMTKCKSCSAEIVFIKTIKGKSMPCEAEPVRFNYKLGAKDRVVTGNGEILPAEIRHDGSEIGYIPHWANCPGADKQRRRKGAKT